MTETATEAVTEETTDAEDTPETTDEDDGADALGDKGKQALDRMKEQRNAARAEAREAREYKALGLSPAEIKKILDERNGADGKPDADAIREEARREARAEAQRERVTDKIEARAAKAFTDAEDAVAILMRNHDPDDFLDGDKIDVDAIQEALNDLLEKKPHLAAQGGKRFTGTGDGGTRKEARPNQLTRDDLKRMSPQEITKAKADGRLEDLLSGKK
jgi:DNA-binding transcriptional MerR regulator